jgi:hypothetical protein
LRFTLELSPLPLLKFGILLRFDFWTNGKSFAWQHGEHSWWKCRCQDHSTGWALVASLNLGSIHRINPWVKGWADWVVVLPRDQFQPWRHRGWQRSRSNTKLLCGIPGHRTVNLHWSKRAARCWPLAPHYWVQVWAPPLYGESENLICSSIAAGWCQSTMGQLHRHSPR